MLLIVLSMTESTRKLQLDLPWRESWNIGLWGTSLTLFILIWRWKVSPRLRSMIRVSCFTTDWFIEFENYFMIAYININTRSQRHSHKTECSIESQFNTINLPETWEANNCKNLYFHSLDIFSTWNEGGLRLELREPTHDR